MKYINDYKNWMHHSSKERYKLERYLNDILYEVKDNGYKYLITGWTDGNPRIWIKIPIKEIDKISGIIKNITSYLESEGFETRIEKLSTNHKDLINEQIRIYFTKLV